MWVSLRRRLGQRFGTALLAVIAPLVRVYLLTELRADIPLALLYA